MREQVQRFAREQLRAVDVRVSSRSKFKGSALMMRSVTPDDPDVLLSIQNNKHPEQVVYLVLDESHEHLETQGLKALFGLKEIRLDTQAVIESLQEYGQVLSHIVETIATGNDLGLPYGYQNEFQFGNARFTLYEEGDHRLLKKVDA
jgi:hypothetical protein